MPLLHQSHKFSLAHHRVAEIEAGEFDLLRVIDAQLFNEPIVQWPVIFKFQCANGMGNPFNGIRLSVGEVIHGIDTPFVACSVMRRMQNTVHDRIAHIQVGVGHINFCPKHARSILELSGSHPFKQSQILFH